MEYRHSRIQPSEICHDLVHVDATYYKKVPIVIIHFYIKMVKLKPGFKEFTQLRFVTISVLRVLLIIIK